MNAAVEPDAGAVRARKCWRTLEPYHGFVYFAPEAHEEYAALGLRGRSGYFVSRSAAMGVVNAATVTATFFNFDPQVVDEAVAGTEGVDRGAVLDARLRAVDRVLTRTLGDDVDSPAMIRAAELACAAAVGLPELSAGRPLAAAHASLPIPDAPHLALWWAATALREFRGDGHLAALVDGELLGIDALVLHAASGEVGRETLQTTRGWSDEAWTASVERLAGRGLVDADGAFTDAGAALRAAMEDRTDRLAAPAWSRLTDDEGAELRALVRPWSQAVFAGLAPG